jgi:hypothetical protein
VLNERLKRSARELKKNSDGKWRRGNSAKRNSVGWTNRSVSGRSRRDSGNWRKSSGSGKNEKLNQGSSRTFGGNVQGVMPDSKANSCPSTNPNERASLVAGATASTIPKAIACAS